MIDDKERLIASELAHTLKVSTNWAREMLLHPAHGGRAGKILSVLDGLKIAPTMRDELRERLLAVQQPPRRKHEKGKKCFAEIGGDVVEVVAASKYRNPRTLRIKEESGELAFVGRGVLLHPMVHPYNRFKTGETLYFWSRC